MTPIFNVLAFVYSKYKSCTVQTLVDIASAYYLTEELIEAVARRIAPRQNAPPSLNYLRRIAPATNCPLPSRVIRIRSDAFHIVQFTQKIKRMPYKCLRNYNVILCSVRLG